MNEELKSLLKICVGLSVRAYTEEPHISTDTVQMIYSNDKKILAFRGTVYDEHDIIRDFVRDGRFLPLPSLKIMGVCHAGFTQSAKSAIKVIKDFPDILTGHSKGAAEALLTAALLSYYGHTPSKIVLFGCPRVAFLARPLSLLESTVYRVVYGSDVVTHMPPHWIGYKHFQDRFIHLGPKDSEPSFFNHRIKNYNHAINEL